MEAFILYRFLFCNKRLHCLFVYIFVIKNAYHSDPHIAGYLSLCAILCRNRLHVCQLAITPRQVAKVVAIVIPTNETCEHNLTHSHYRCARRSALGRLSVARDTRAYNMCIVYMAPTSDIHNLYYCFDSDVTCAHCTQIQYDAPSMQIADCSTHRSATTHAMIQYSTNDIKIVRTLLRRLVLDFTTHKRSDYLTPRRQPQKPTNTYNASALV